MKEKFNEIMKKMNARENEEAFNMLKELANELEEKMAQDGDNVTHFSLNTPEQQVLFFHYFKIDKTKENRLYEVSVERVYYYLGYLAIELGKDDEAIEYYKKALELNPTDPVTMFEIAYILNKKGEIEEAKKYTDDAHKFVYTFNELGRYFRELGYYYVEKGEYKLANAIYSLSLNYADNKNAYNELKYIAEQAGWEPYMTTVKDIGDILDEANINPSFCKESIDAIYARYKALGDAQNYDGEFKQLGKTMYTITGNKRFLMSDTYKNEKFGVQIQVPCNYTFVSEEFYDKVGVSNKVGTIFVFLDEDRRKVTVSYLEKCTKDNFEEKYNESIQKVCQNEISLVEQFTVQTPDGVMKQAFIEIEGDDPKNKTRIVLFYMCVNGYLMVVDWKVRNNDSVENILSEVNNHLSMDLVWSLREIEASENNKSEDK